METTKREKAIRTCFAKILLQDSEISYEDAMIKATKWYDRIEERNRKSEEVKSKMSLFILASEEFGNNFIGPITHMQYIEQERAEFEDSFIGPRQISVKKKSLLDIMSM